MIICPHCEKSLGPEHNKKACGRKSSRRHFLGTLLGGIAAAVAPKPRTRTTRWYECPSSKYKFQFGFTGFKEVQNGIGITGEFLWAVNIVAPRTAFKVLNFDGGQEMNCLIYPSKKAEPNATS